MTKLSNALYQNAYAKTYGKNLNIHKNKLKIIYALLWAMVLILNRDSVRIPAVSNK